MPFPPKIGEDARYMEQVIEQTETALSRLRQAKHLIGEVEGTGEAADGLVRVTANSGGSLTKVDINPRALRLSVAALGNEVTEAIRLAQQDASRRTGEIVEDAAASAGIPQPLDETFVRERVEAAAHDMYRQS
ncbi:YbaB/EbfC family nucleoid-associated protein [Streptosporangium sp. NBC_01469]|uniref:YbaB/EbfC family nucleoid-associated protein n=1 Tax=Streptosporangium sp. NBC_01469 TaxID=2903898 RepID=UPI002E29822A|nr:YbaB/EbfC family nucleoid-associated protein [Streptosporangium sp. NBC_01469]